MAMNRRDILKSLTAGLVSGSVLRVIPAVVEMNRDLKNRDVLRDPAFLRERLGMLPPKKFESLSSACKYAVNGQLYAWDRELGRH